MDRHRELILLIFFFFILGSVCDFYFSINKSNFNVLHGFEIKAENKLIRNI